MMYRTLNISFFFFSTVRFIDMILFIIIYSILNKFKLFKFYCIIEKYHYLYLFDHFKVELFLNDNFFNDF
jgi:hypothetical protein